MKKGYIFAISVIFLLAMSFGIAGCKNRSKTPVSTPVAPASNATNTVGNETISGSDSGNVVSNAPVKTNIDFTVTDSYFSPIYPEPNEEVKLKIIVKNLGTESAQSFDYSVKIYKDGNLIKEDKLSSDSAIAAGGELKITNIYKFPNKGKYYAEVYIDPENKIGELVETNNYMKTKADATVMDKIINPPRNNTDDGE